MIIKLIIGNIGISTNPTVTAMSDFADRRSPIHESRYKSIIAIQVMTIIFMYVFINNKAPKT